MIAMRQLTKTYGRRTVVDRLTVDVRPGAVTGFVGPNGAGKSTTLRMLVGLTTPDSGAALVAGRSYRSSPAPLRTVGALLDAGAFHPGRRAHAHLRWLAASNGLPAGRVEQVLGRTGLAGVADRRVGGFSLGMRQRLGIAAALLGDPEVLLLDEPVNGLDPDGIRWVRHLVRELAADGRTVLLSSHLMNETAMVADTVLVLARGRLVADAPVAELTREHGSLEEAYLALTAGLAEHVAVEGGAQ
jgi:ABC-2 type transport system ATP-binding protein